MELTAAEGRVLGCLIELEALAPDAVPFTLNTLRLACNQSTGRDPVVAYDDRTVEDTLLALKSRGLARFVPPTAEVRTTRYRHRADQRWRMGPADLAVLAVLLLRGVQSVGEVRSQVQRLDPAVGPHEVEAVLDALAARTPRPFAARVNRSPGDQPPRWVQVLTPPAPDGDDAGPGGETPGDGVERPGRTVVAAELASPSYAALVARVADLERRLAVALERRPPVVADRDRPAFPPPPPPVDVRPAPAQLEARTDSGLQERRPRAVSGDDTFGGGPPGEAPPAVSEVVERLRDIERRLARIEAELGALR